MSPTTSAPEPAPQPAGTDTAVDEARAAEHAAVDLALLRTLGFADPNPRPGAAPVVDLAVVHEEEEPLAPGQAVPVRFLVVQRDRLPVGDAAVTLLDPRGRETASASADVEGRGEVTAPRPGGYVLVAAADGHQPGVVALTVPDTEYAVAEVEVQLVRSSTVAGAVRDVRGSGVAHVAVSLLQDGELVATTITSAAGGYRFGELAAGEYTIAVVAEGREPRIVPVRVGEEADAAQDVVLAGPVAQPSAAGEH
ncbi:carboxypeptidase-like regulatory domain-containing protein [Pseudonocardia sp. RS11V-5]|nr:carboxypeptidase-like regulatory domain-containing protein [Pseudonocardia terrae]